MQLPINSFKRALVQGRPQIGLWVGLADPCVAELFAGAGFDWLLLDGGHAPNDVRSVVRPVVGDTALAKQYLDAGAQTRLIPMVDSAEQAAAMVAATRHPPHGVLGVGVGAALPRASLWNGISNCLQRANDEMCVRVQAESVAAPDALDAIAAMPGVDGVSFGPADLAASTGCLGQPGAPAAQAAISDGIARVRTVGKATGILTADPALARSYLDLGALFVAVGVGTTLLGQAAHRLAAQFQPGAAASAAPAIGGVY